MISFKRCMVGSYAVGKTSLVERYVHSIYSDAYHTTIGVKIDKKVVTTDSGDANCLIWDIAGEDEFYTFRNSYLRGMAGYFLVLDGTRRVTVDTAIGIHKRVLGMYPNVPCVVLVNKSDLTAEAEVTATELGYFGERRMPVVPTSAKSGEGVEDAFALLADSMFARRQAG